MKIEVRKSALSKEIIHTFDSADSFVSYVNSNEPSEWGSDQIVIDGSIFLGWDEIELHLNSCQEKEYTTEELLSEFKVLGFSHGYCAVERISDGQKGSFDFGGRPRKYFNFVKS